MIVTLIRHGETIWQDERRYQGISDVPLSDKGAAKLQKAEFQPPVVFVTELIRTGQTADVLFPGVPQIVCPGLGEMNFGEFEGKNYSELAGRADYQSWVDSGCLDPCPGGESKEEFCRRVCSAFECLMDSRAGEPELVLVAHGGTLMAVLERFGRPKRNYFDWQCGCGCGFRLKAEKWEEEHILLLEEQVYFTGGN